MEYLLIIPAYLLGSLPWSLIIGKLFYHTDIRQQGSGNLGGTNAGRVLGKKAGVIVMALDIIKAIIAVWLGSLASLPVGALCGIFCAIGHCYPLFAGFKGGKAVSTAVGFLFSVCLFLQLNWLLLIIPAVIFFAVLYFSKMVSLASIAMFVTAVIVAFIIPSDWIIRGTVIILALLIIFKHQANIHRIIDHTESKITWM